MAVDPARIEDLVGEELGGVHFVRDYVEFHFDGPIVRSLSIPVVHDAGREQPRLPAPGSRDALCALIGRALAAVEDREDEAIHLRFDDGVWVIIPTGPLGGADSSLGEYAHFVPGIDRPISVR